MTSHLTRMQYQQQRMNNMNRTESYVSLSSEDPLRVIHPSTKNCYDQTGSTLSGSNISSKIPSQVSSIGNTYQNIIKNTRGSKSTITYSIVNEGSQNDTLRMEEGKIKSGSISSCQPPTMISKSIHGSRSIYLPSHFRMSRSLKASKASLATYKSGRSTIQAEYHDRKVQREINSVKFGRAKILYWIAVGFYIMFLIVLFIGLLITCLRHIYMNIILSLDVGEMIGPLLIACSFLFFGAGMKFYYDAYKLGCEERRQIIYQAASPSTVAIATMTKRIADHDEKLVSGKTSQNALTRAPIGSRTTLVMP